MSIKGFKSQQALSKKLGGYTEDQSIDQARYVTVQEMSGKRHALDVIIQGAYQIGALPSTVGTNSNIRVIKCVAHGASKNDIIRLSNGTQFSAISIPDADTIITSVELDADPTGDTFTIWRHITPSYNSDGSLNTSQGPVQFIDNNTVVKVKNDDSVPANNIPLPSAMMIKKDDGNFYPVTLDTTNPYAHTPIPVCITDVSGTTNVTITAGDINVGIKHNGADPSSVRIGDGTNLAAVSATNALKVDGSAVTQPISATALPLPTGASTSANQTTANSSLSSIVTNTANPPVKLQDGAGNGITSSSTAFQRSLDVQLHDNFGNAFQGQQTMSLSLPVTIASNQSSLSVSAASLPLPSGASTSANQVTANASLSSIDGKLTSVATSTLQTSGNASLTSIDGKLTNAATTTLQTTGNTSLNNLDINQGAKADTVATTDTGTFSLISLVKKIAANITSLALQLPVSLGIKTASASLSMAPASDAVFTIAPQSNGAGTITTAQKAVGTAAARATVSGTAPASRKKLIISPSPLNTGNVFLGSSSVTISTGLQIIGPDKLEFLSENNDYYLISDTAAQVVNILEVY